MAKELEPEVEARSRPGRVSQLEKLLSSERGKQQYNEMLLAISSRASAVCAAAMIGIHPNTLSNWLARGKREDEGIYRNLYDDVVSAVGSAATACEIELNHQSPKMYLTRGFGRVLLGDSYNISAEVPTLTYNVDGTLSASNDSAMAIRDNVNNSTPLIESQDSGADVVSERLAIEALQELRANGIDLNALVDSTLDNGPGTLGDSTE